MENNLLSGLRNMGVRLSNHGGVDQQDRMIRDKRRTFDKVVKYSYQGAKVKDLGSESSNIVRALINPNKVKMDQIGRAHV